MHPVLIKGGPEGRIDNKVKALTGGKVYIIGLKRSFNRLPRRLGKCALGTSSEEYDCVSRVHSIDAHQVVVYYLYRAYHVLKNFVLLTGSVAL
jgi:hypothetical protein